MTRSNAFIRGLERAAMTVVSGAIGYRMKFGTGPAEPSGPQRVLICKWCCLGDAVVSLYAIREFKNRNPATIIDMLVSSRIAEVYRRATEINEVHVLPLTGKRLVLELLKPTLWTRFFALIFRLRQAQYAQFIDLELYRGTGPVLKRLIGIPFSRGFQVEGALPKHHDFEVPLPRRMPEWQCFYRVLGLDIPPAPPEALYRRESPSRQTQAGKIPTAPLAATPIPAASSPIPPSPQGKRIGIVFGSSFNWPQKKWPWDNYAELISLLSLDGHAFVLLGASDETEEGARIAARAAANVIDTTGQLDYAGLCREVSACDLLIGNDTGTMHLAAAYGIPTVTLFGPTDPEKWNPLTSTPVFLATVPCRPCYYLGSMPPCDHFSCLRKLEPSLVAETVRGVLSGANKSGQDEQIQDGIR
ncbi:MAG: glycosyltransferase family 9 protein [Fibrobacteria bacterium]